MTQRAQTQKTILITGCSSGIGLDAAWALHEKGWQVIASCRKEADCAHLRRQGLASVRIDYEEPTSIEAGFAEALAITGGRLDVLFNNGAYAIPGALEDMPTDAIRQIFESNFFGWHSLTRLAIPVMRAQGTGRIIQNSSVLGFAALRWRGPYNATKFALEGYTDTLRLEMRGTGIELILIEPGPIRTKIRENSWPHFEKWIDVQASVRRRFYEKALIPRLTVENPPKDPFELGVEATTKAILHACEASRPRRRYRITWATKLMYGVKKILPTRLFDHLAVRF